MTMKYFENQAILRAKLPFIVQNIPLTGKNKKLLLIVETIMYAAAVELTYPQEEGSKNDGKYIQR